MISLIMTMLLACGDKEVEDTAAVEEIEEGVQETAPEPAEEVEDSGEAE